MLVDVTYVSNAALLPVRDGLLKKSSDVMAPGGGRPELLRSQLQRMRPEDDSFLPGRDAALSRFEFTLLTAGSGTQIFRPTFVQWAAREALRREPPETLLARYAPRKRDAQIGVGTSAIDPGGSLVDGEMGAYYTWINQQRLAGAEQSRFVVWYEAHKQAVVIGPSLRAGSEQSAATTRIDRLVADLP